MFPFPCWRSGRHFSTRTRPSGFCTGFLWSFGSNQPTIMWSQRFSRGTAFHAEPFVQGNESRPRFDTYTRTVRVQIPYERVWPIFGDQYVHRLGATAQPDWKCTRMAGLHPLRRTGWFCVRTYVRPFFEMATCALHISETYACAIYNLKFKIGNFFSC